MEEQADDILGPCPLRNYLECSRRLFFGEMLSLQFGV